MARSIRSACSSVCLQVPVALPQDFPGAASGSIDIIVNNAGLMVFKPLEEHAGEDWSRILGVDVIGAFYFVKQAFLRMPAGGAIVNVASVHAIETEPMVALYAAAKAALLSLTRSAALEGKPKASA